MNWMVQVWDKGGWSDYWPVGAANRRRAREQARQALAPFWLARRWRVTSKRQAG